MAVVTSAMAAPPLTELTVLEAVVVAKAMELAAV